MKKIKTITCHNVYNYGASLQAYALQHFLETLGHDVEIIDYNPRYLQKAYNFWYVPENSRLYKLTQKNIIILLLFSLWSTPKKFKTWKRIKPFKFFKKHILKCTKETYSTYEELKNNAPLADVYIAGSDQIWNTSLVNGKDPAFFLNFGKNVKKISYAASFGLKKLEHHQKNVKTYLQALDAISVRETSALKILNEMGYKGIPVMDPVFLLSKKDWLKFLENYNFRNRINYKYVLVYDIFFDDDNLKKSTLKYAKENNLKVVSVDNFVKTPYADINISNAGPIEFLGLFRDAEAIFSCSFHATAFSVILNKNFGVFYNKKNSSRMIDFLQSVELSHCFNPKEIDCKINWNKVNNLLNSNIEKSVIYLTDNLK